MIVSLVSGVQFSFVVFFRLFPFSLPFTACRKTTLMLMDQNDGLYEMKPWDRIHAGWFPQLLPDFVFMEEL